MVTIAFSPVHKLLAAIYPLSGKIAVIRIVVHLLGGKRLLEMVRLKGSQDTQYPRILAVADNHAAPALVSASLLPTSSPPQSSYTCASC